MFQETMEAMRIMGIPEEEQMGTEWALLWLKEGRQGRLIVPLEALGQLIGLARASCWL